MIIHINHSIFYGEATEHGNTIQYNNEYLAIYAANIFITATQSQMSDTANVGAYRSCLDQSQVMIELNCNFV